MKNLQLFLSKVSSIASTTPEDIIKDFIDIAKDDTYCKMEICGLMPALSQVKSFREWELEPINYYVGIIVNTIHDDFKKWKNSQLNETGKESLSETIRIKQQNLNCQPVVIHLKNKNSSSYFSNAEDILKENVFIDVNLEKSDSQSFSDSSENIEFISETLGFSDEMEKNKEINNLIKAHRFYVSKGAHLYYITTYPILKDQSHNSRFLGGVYYLFNKEIDGNGYEVETFLTITTILAQKVANAYNILEVKKQAVKSAKAAIMSRNMSHNLGSHVLYYLRQHLSGDVEQIAHALANIVFEPCDPNEPEKMRIRYRDESDSSISEVFNKHKFEIPFLRGLGTFLTYLQERQDFIASIATDSIPSFTTVNFKDFVIDNLTKDKKAQRHGSESRKELNILLKYIAKSEDADIEITFNGHSLNTDNPLSAENDTMNLYDYSVDLPGGILGRQAIYSILENIIRNSAKHGKRDDSKLIINISIEDSPDSEFKDEFYVVKISDNNNLEGDSLIEELNGFLKEELIDNDTHQLCENHKGIKEILISSLWLCGRNISGIAVEKRNQYIEVKKEKDRLCYQFYLYKSKQALIVIDNGSIAKFDNNSSIVNQFSINAVVTYDHFLENNIKARRYNLIVDATTDYKLNLLKDSFRRYLAISYDEIMGKKWLNEDIYIYLFHHYLEKKFNLKGNWPKFKFNINTNGSEINKKANLKIFNNCVFTLTTEGEINYSDNSIEINPKSNYIESSKKAIAYRRHIHNKPNDLFVHYPFDIDGASDATYEIIKKIKKAYYSIESVTGDNSSFRRINNMKIDDLWVLEEVEAACSRVLIIDERLFDTYRKNSPQKTTNNLEGLKKIISEILVLNNCNSLTDEIVDSYCKRIYEINYPLHGLKNSETDKNEVIRYISDQLQLDIIDINIEKLDYYFQEIEKMRELISNSDKKKAIDNKLPFLLSLKSVDISTLKNNNLESLWCEIGKFSGYNLELNNEYDFISIHQGILDKMYNDRPNELSKTVKGDYFAAVLNNLKSKASSKLIVHTGRGKPNYIKGVVGFRSLSDLDYAIREPKQIIVDYFTSASYE